MPVAHALLTLPHLASAQNDIANAAQSYTCPRDATLCNFVNGFTDAHWALALTDLLVAPVLSVSSSVVLILALALVARALARRGINRFTAQVAQGTVPERWRWRDRADPSAGGAAMFVDERRRQRAETIGSLLRSAASVLIFTIAFVMVLDQFGIAVGPIIASAGILGVALGFGSQTLVKDFLSGIFMLLEDQYGVGDVIDTGAATGIVEAVGLRVTRLRDVDGVVWHVRNGEVLRIGNHSQGWARSVIDVPVPYAEDIDRMQAVLKDVADDLWQDDAWNELVLEEPEIWGVQDLAADGALVRVVIKTAPLQQWAVGRELRRRVKATFDRENIEIPFPQRTVWLRHDDQPAPGPSDTRRSATQPGSPDVTAAPPHGSGADGSAWRP